MESNNKELNFDKVLNKIGFPVKLDDYRATYKYNVDYDQVLEFEHELRQSFKMSYYDILETILKNQNLFDTEVYLFHVGKLAERDYKNSKETEILGTNFENKVYINPEAGKPLKFAVEYFYNMLKDIDVVDISINPINKELVIESSQVLAGNKALIRNNGKQNREKILKIQEKIDLKELLYSLEPNDLIEFCNYTNLGAFLEDTTFERMKDIDIPETKEDKFLRVLMNYADYLNLDRMLVLINLNIYNKYADKYDQITKEEIDKLNHVTNIIETLLDDRFVTYRFRNNGDLYGFQKIKSSIKTLNSCFIDGKFLTVEEKNNMIQNLILGQTDIKDIDKNTFNKLFTATSDYFKEFISQKPEALSFLLENNYINNEEINDLIKNGNIISSNNIKEFYKIGIIGNDELLNSFVNNRIDIDFIKQLQEETNRREELNKLLSIEKVVEAFFSKKKKDKLKKYIELYNFLHVEGKSIEERRKSIREAFASSTIDISNAKRLYNMEVIPAESLVDLVQDFDLANFYANGNIKPKDARRLFEENIITKDVIEEILSNSEIPIMKKLVLIYSTFPSNEDKSIRDEFISYLTNIQDKTYDSNDLVEEYQRDKNITNEEMLEPFARWKVLSGFDNEYSQKILDDGHMVFFLPNENISIIEKLYNKNNQIAYGAATYIMDTDKFEKNRNSIIVNNKINITNLNQFNKNGDARKLIHIGWGNAMINYIESLKKEKINENN